MPPHLLRFTLDNPHIGWGRWRGCCSGFGCLQSFSHSRMSAYVDGLFSAVPIWLAAVLGCWHEILPGQLRPRGNVAGAAASVEPRDDQVGTSKAMVKKWNTPSTTAGARIFAALDV